jgi:hypothetical protein
MESFLRRRHRFVVTMGESTKRVSPDSIPGSKPSTPDQQITANDNETQTVSISWASVKPLLFGCHMAFAFELQSTNNADPIFQFTGKPKRNTGGPNS